jgi:aspartyl-tRNA(Asn)/glutamyl-tRNA(Gln) amidotransferase subunit B
MTKSIIFSSLQLGQDYPDVYRMQKPKQVTDAAAIEKWIEETLAENPKQLKQYRAGKTTVKAFFVGQVMKKSKGLANPKLVNDLLDKKLGG